MTKEILVVDSHSLFRQFMEDMLKLKNYRVLLAENGQGGLKLLDENI